MSSASAIARHVQLVLSDRTALSEGRNFGVLSPLTSCLADLGANHAFLITYRIWRVAGDDRQQRAWRERGIASA